MAAEIIGAENHDELIRNSPEYAYRLTQSPLLLIEYHAILATANRLEMFVRDCEPPTIIDVSDLADGALRTPFIMERRDELSLVRFIRKALQGSPITKVEVSSDREVLLLAFVYSDAANRSILSPVDGSAFRLFRRVG